MLRVSLRSLLVILVLVGRAGWISAQTGTDASSVQDQIASIAQDIASADSTHDTLTAINARLDLASLVGPMKAVRLSLEAAALADSTVGATALSLRAHRSLADLFTAMGEMTKANRELVLVQQLTQETLEREAADALERAQEANLHMAAERDSLSVLLGTERETATNRAKEQEAALEQWKLITYASGGAAAFIILVSVFLFGRAIRRMRRELKELKQEVTWLRMVNRKAIEEKAAAPVTPPVAAKAPAPVAPPIAAPVPEPTPSPLAELSEDDAMLLALVRRRGSERLTTLRDARKRGDHDKVIRVVHSLKPQLVSLDAEYYTALCTRLVAQNAPQLASWNADLDALERGMGQLLAAH